MASSEKERIARAREQLRTGDTTEASLLAKERSRARSKAHQRERDRIVKAYEEELSKLEIRQAFLDVLEDATPPDPIKIAKKKGQGRKDPAATYFMLASDWHLGERVRPENVGGRNAYNPEIAQERARQFFKSQLVMLKAARAAWDVRDGVLWLGGDIMTGWIHEDQLIENFLSPVEEVLLAHKVLISGIDYLLAESDLEHIVVVCNHGNHGRTGKKILVSCGARDSHEWLLYQFIRRYYLDEKRLHFRIANGYNETVDCYGFRVCFHHGDAVRYMGGVGGPSIPINRRIGRQAQSLPVRWEGTERGVPHLYVQGHLHQLHYPGFYICNGSLIGWNDFADRIGCPYEDPRQASFVVDERFKIVSNFNPIIVEKRGR